MPARSRDHDARADREELFRSAQQLAARAQRAKLNSLRLISDAQRLIAPVLCGCGEPLYSGPNTTTRVCPACRAAGRNY